MKKFFLILLSVILLFIVIPFLVNFGGNNLSIESRAEFNNWLGFWGSYLGGIFGSIAVIGTTYMLIQHERKLSDKNFLQKVNREEELIVKQDRLERQRLLINFKLSSNALFAQKLNEIQSIANEIHNTLLRAVVLKAAILKKEEINYTNEDVISMRDEAIEKNKLMLDIVISIVQEVKGNKDVFDDFIEVHDNFKRIALEVRSDNFDFKKGDTTLKESQKKFLTLWKKLLDEQMSEKENLIKSLVNYKN